VLDQLYDAEVAYQDDYLGRLFDVLAKRDDRANMLTIITAAESARLWVTTTVLGIPLVLTRN